MRPIISLAVTMLLLTSVSVTADTDVFLPLVRYEPPGVPSATQTVTPTATGQSTATHTPTPTHTATGQPTATHTATSTPTATSRQTATATRTATSTSTPTATRTQTATPTATATVPVFGACPCQADEMNCSDFATRGEAQACYDWCVSQGAGDIHKLDADDDGDACESLPLSRMLR